MIEQDLAEFGDKGLQIIAVTVDKVPDDVRDFIARYPPQFTIAGTRALPASRWTASREFIDMITATVIAAGRTRSTAPAYIGLKFNAGTQRVPP